MLLLLVAALYAVSGAPDPAPTNPNVGGGGGSRRTIEAMFGRRPVITQRDILRTRKRIAARPVVVPVPPVVRQIPPSLGAVAVERADAAPTPYVVTSSDLALAFHPAPRPDPAIAARAEAEHARHAAEQTAHIAAVKAAQDAADDEAVVHALAHFLLS